MQPSLSRNLNKKKGYVMDIDKIMMLVDKVAASPISSLSIEEGSLKISIKKQGMQVVAKSANVNGVISSPPASQPASQVIPEVIDVHTNEILAPIVGTFYAAANPKNGPFVKVGDSVKTGQVIGLIEAMKLMNEIESDTDGIITEILVENEQGVEYGQPLFKVKTKGM